MQKEIVTKKGWYAFGGGALAAFLMFFLFPQFVYIFYYLIVIVHEFGHAIISWIFGYPSLPSFDFLYGGGFAPTWERNSMVQLAVYGAIGWLIFKYRAHAHAARLSVGLLLIYSLVAFSPLHGTLINFMGHGMELIFATIFMYIALSGVTIQTPIERPLYGFCGFYIQLYDVRFAYKLMTSEVFRSQYANAKGEGHVMDFVRIASELGNINITFIAAIFFLMALSLPFIALSVYEYKNYIKAYFSPHYAASFPLDKEESK
jgi:hypothetical protein